MSTLPQTVVCTFRFPGDIMTPLNGIARVVQAASAGDPMPRAEVLRHAGTAAAIVCQGELRVDAELLAMAPHLRVVAQTAVGSDNLADLPLLTAKGIWATNAGGAFAEATADCAFALVLAVARRIVEADDYVRAGQWSGFQPGRWDGMLLQERTMGVVGFGRIGRAVARRAEAFGMRVVHHTRTPTGDPGFRSLENLLAESDVVCLALPLNAQSDRMFDRQRFEQMKAEAILVNVARGRIVVEEALVAALKSRRLRGAGLDVFEREPSVHPMLIGMSNVVLLPHIGGGTRESRASAQALAIANVEAVLQGRGPITPLNEPVAP